MNSGINKGIRSSNFEALRIVCMLFIVAGHIIMWHDVKSETLSLIINCGIRPFFMVAVDCFVLISGWFGIKYNLKKILTLNSTLTFWALTICAIALFIGIHSVDIKKDILMLIPLVTRRYWFITIYVALCLIAPYLNAFIESLSQPVFKKLIIVNICLFVILPTLGAILNFDALTIDSGYGIVNFVILYLLGRYMRMYANPNRPKTTYLLCYIALMSGCGIFQYAYSRLLHTEFTTLFSYDTFFVFFGAVALFCFFSKLTFSNRMVNNLATACFAVYIIHIHPWTGKWVYENLLGLEKLRDEWFLGAVFILPIATYILCYVLETTRQLAIRMFTPPIFNKR